jgi:hypothetical protein
MDFSIWQKITQRKDTKQNANTNINLIMNGYFQNVYLTTNVNIL